MRVIHTPLTIPALVIIINFSNNLFTYSILYFVVTGNGAYDTRLKRSFLAVTVASLSFKSPSTPCYFEGGWTSFLEVVDNVRQPLSTSLLPRYHSTDGGKAQTSHWMQRRDGSSY